MDVVSDFGERSVLERSAAGAQDERYSVYHRAPFRVREVAVSKDAVEEKVAAIEALRSSTNAVEPLRKALRDRNNFVCSKAAAVAGDLLLRELIPDLLAAFERFLKDPVKSDPKCWAKNAIVKALKDLGHDDAAIYLRGIGHVQMEPVWGGSADSAGARRGGGGLGLVGGWTPRG